MIIFLIALPFLEPEDSNNLYLMDQILTVPQESFLLGYDSLISGFYTNQGCLDLLNWYIDLRVKHDLFLSKRLGIRYRYWKLGDYSRQIDEHRFEPTLLFGSHRLHLMITPRYYKGDDEIGIGYSHGNYLNYLSFFFSVPDFDRNFSLQYTPDSLPSYRYKRFPLRFSFEIRRRWRSGYLKLIIDRTLPSFQVWKGHESIWKDRWRFSVNLTSWHGRFNLNFTSSYEEKNRRSLLFYAREADCDSINWLEAQPGIGYRFSNQITIYFSYRIDSKFHATDSFNYHRSGNAQYLDIHYQLSDKYLWHFGYQGEYVRSGELKIVNNHRFIIGLEYIFKKGKFVLWEGIEADRPFRLARFHNHTYLSLIFSF